MSGARRTAQARPRPNNRSKRRLSRPLDGGRINTIDTKVMTTWSSWLVTIVCDRKEPISGRLRDGVFSRISPRTWSVSPGIDRLAPPEFVDARRAEPGLLLADDVTRDDRHGHGRGVPAARRDPAEMGLGRFLVRQMEGLRIIFARELEHFLAGDFIAAEIGLGADLQVFEIDHGGAHSGAPRLALR